MPEVELSTLSGPELRSLLNSARSRGQAAASYQILQEMAERREGRRSDPPRVVDLDLGDPMAGDETPEPEIEAEAEAEAPLYLAPPPQRARRKAGKAAPPPEPPPPSVWDDVPEAPAPRLQGLPHPGRPGFARVAVFAAGIVVGAAAGWGAASLDLGRQAAPAASDAPPRDMLRIADQALPPTPVPPSAAAPAQIQVVEAPPPGDAVAAGFREEPLPLPPAEPDAAAEPEAAPRPPAAVVQAATAPAPVPEPPKITVLKKPDAACAAEPTPADRAICADPDLRRLQRELRAAYGDALEAHEDRDLLRQRQLAWRDARNTLTDPDRLAELYEARIRKLHAAAEAAREGR